MPIFCRLQRDKNILRGPVTKMPYKGWFELSNYYWGSANPAAAGTTGNRSPENAKSELTIVSSFVDFYIFATSYDAYRPFKVQIDDVESNLVDMNRSIILSETMVGGVVSAGQGDSPSLAVSFVATTVEYYYIGARNKGAPAYTLTKAKKKGS